MNVYYISRWGQGGEHPFVDRVGIPQDQITGNIDLTSTWKYPVYIMHGWGQPIKDKARIVKQRLSRALPTFVFYDYSYEAGLGSGGMQEVADLVQSWGLSAQHHLLWSLNSAARDHVKAHRVCLWDYYAVDAVYRLAEVAPTQLDISKRQPYLNFLAAKLELKPTRLWALYSLWRCGLLKGAQLGLLATEQGLARHRGLIKDDQFWTWLWANLGPRDHVMIAQDNNSITAKGYPYDAKIYERSVVSYVCETNGVDWGGPDEFITEKTYRPIMNRSPFVIQAGSTTLDWLVSQGFDVYKKYTGNPNYGQHRGGWSHIPRCVEAAQRLLTYCQTHADQIQAIADSNYNNLVEIARRDRQRIRQFIGLPPT